MPFNYTAEVSLRLNTGSLNAVQQQIRSGLRGASAALDLGLNPSQVAQLDAYAKALARARSHSVGLDQAGRGLTASLSTARNSAAALNREIHTGSEMTARAARGYAALHDRTHEATNSMAAFAHQAGLAARRYLAFSLAAGTMLRVAGEIKSAVSEAVKFNREMVRLQQVSEGSAGEVRGIAAEVTRLARGFGVSSTELMRSTVLLRQAGLDAEQTTRSLEALAKAALAPNFDSIAQTTEGAIAVMQQFKIGAEGMEGALGSMNAVAGAFAVEAGDLIEVVKRAGGVFASLSAATKDPQESLNELMALFTSVRHRTREDASVISNGLKTIFTRIQRPETVEALDALGVKLRHTREELIATGQSMNLKDQFVGNLEAIRRISQAMSQIPPTDARFARIAEQLGGVWQIGRVIPMINQFADAQRAMSIAQAGQVSLANNAAQAQEALSVKLQRAKEHWLSLGRTVADSTGFRQGVDGLERLSDVLSDLLRYVTPLIPALATLAAIKIGSAAFMAGGAFLSNTSSGTRPTLRRMAAGGIVPGTGYGDKVPALLEPGEKVIPRHEVRRFAGGSPGGVKPRYLDEFMGIPVLGGVPLHKIPDSQYLRAAIGDNPSVPPLIRGIVTHRQKAAWGEVSSQGDIYAGSSRLKMKGGVFHIGQSEYLPHDKLRERLARRGITGRVLFHDTDGGPLGSRSMSGVDSATVELLDRYGRRNRRFGQSVRRATEFGYNDMVYDEATGRELIGSGVSFSMRGMAPANYKNNHLGFKDFVDKRNTLDLVRLFGNMSVEGGRGRVSADPHFAGLAAAIRETPRENTAKAAFMDLVGESAGGDAFDLISRFHKAGRFARGGPVRSQSLLDEFHGVPVVGPPLAAADRRIIDDWTQRYPGMTPLVRGVATSGLQSAEYANASRGQRWNLTSSLLTAVGAASNRFGDVNPEYLLQHMGLARRGGSSIDAAALHASHYGNNYLGFKDWVDGRNREDLLRLFGGMGVEGGGAARNLSHFSGLATSIRTNPRENTPKYMLADLLAENTSHPDETWKLIDRFVRAGRFASGGSVSGLGLGRENPLWMIDSDPGRATVSFGERSYSAWQRFGVPHSRLGRRSGLGPFADRGVERLLERGELRPARLDAGLRPETEQDLELLLGMMRLGGGAAFNGNAFRGAVSVPLGVAGRVPGGVTLTGDLPGHWPTAFRGREGWLKTGDPAAGTLWDYRHSREGQALLEKIPSDATFLGAGVQAIGLDAGDGTVFRLGKRDRTPFGGTPASNYVGRRPASEFLLPTLEAHRAGRLVIERTEKISPLSDLVERGEIRSGQANNYEEAVRRGLSRDGVVATDAKQHNIGLTARGNPILFDPGFLTPSFSGPPSRGVPEWVERHKKAMGRSPFAGGGPVPYADEVGGIPMIGTGNDRVRPVAEAFLKLHPGLAPLVRAIITRRSPRVSVINPRSFPTAVLKEPRAHNSIVRTTYRPDLTDRRVREVLGVRGATARYQQAIASQLDDVFPAAYRETGRLYENRNRDFARHMATIRGRNHFNPTFAEMFRYADDIGSGHTRSERHVLARLYERDRFGFKDWVDGRNREDLLRLFGGMGVEGGGAARDLSHFLPLAKAIRANPRENTPKYMLADLLAENTSRPDETWKLVDRFVRSGRFASGGLVGGVGNTDSVPVDLPPGSYVIRKSSVNKIGAENLARFPRFAAGGVSRETVPALVMPGEYIYSPEEVSKIGKSTLDKINRYAAGGPVRRYADGGFHDAFNDAAVRLPFRPVTMGMIPSARDADMMKASLAKTLAASGMDRTDRESQGEASKRIDRSTKELETATKLRRRSLDDSSERENLLAKANAEAAKATKAKENATLVGKGATQAEAEAFTLNARAAKSMAAAHKEADRAVKLQGEANASADPKVFFRKTQQADAAVREAQRLGAESAGFTAQAAKAQQNATLLRRYEAAFQQKADAADLNRVGFQGAADYRERSAAVYAARSDTLAGRNALIETTDFRGNRIVRSVMEEERAAADAARTRTGKDTLMGIAEGRAEDRLKNFRGMLGEQGKQGVMNAEMAKMEQQYVRAVANQIRSIDKSTSAQEAMRMATERFEAGMKNNSIRVATNASGAIIGDKNLVTSSGAMAPQMGFLERKWTGFKNSLRDPDGRLSLGSAMSSQGVMSAAFVAPMVVEALRSATTSNPDVVAMGRGSETLYQAGQVATGMTSLGLTGLIAGGAAATATGVSSLTGIGALVGAAAGVASGLHEARKQVTEARLGIAVQKVSDELNYLWRGMKDFGPGSAGLIREQQAAVRSETAEKARGESSYLFGLVGNPEGARALAERYGRTEGGKQLPGLLSLLARQVDDRARDKGYKGETADQLVAGVLAANGNFFQEQLGVIAKQLGTSPGQERDKLVKQAGDAINAVRSDEANRKMTSSLAQAVVQLEGLAQAARAASLGLDASAEAINLHAGLFDGQRGGGQITALSRGLAGPDGYVGVAGLAGGFLRPGQGQELTDQAGAMAFVTRELPGIIATANSARGAEGKPADFASDVIERLTAGAKAAGVVTPLGGFARAADALRGQLASKDFDKLADEAGQDVAKLTRDLLQGITRPFEDGLRAVTAVMERAANQYAEGLKNVSDREGQVLDRRGATRRAELELLRRRAGDASEQRGLGREAGVDGLTREQIDAPFRRGQADLAGRYVADPFSPDAIGRRLGEVNAALPAARERRDMAVLTQNALGGRREYDAAFQAFDDLETESVRLVKALHNLADPALAAAGAMEKLGRIQQEEQGRLGLARTQATESFEERYNRRRGERLANEVAATGGGRKLRPEDAQLLFAATRAAADVPMFNGMRGGEVETMYLRKHFPVAALPGAKPEEKKTLQQEITAAFATAVEAGNQIEKNQFDQLVWIRQLLEKQNAQVIKQVEMEAKGSAVAAKEAERFAKSQAIQERGPLLDNVGEIRKLFGDDANLLAKLGDKGASDALAGYVADAEKRGVTSRELEAVESMSPQHFFPKGAALHYGTREGRKFLDDKIRSLAADGTISGELGEEARAEFELSGGGNVGYFRDTLKAVARRKDDAAMGKLHESMTPLKTAGLLREDGTGVANTYALALARKETALEPKDLARAADVQKRFYGGQSFDAIAENSRTLQTDFGNLSKEAEELRSAFTAAKRAFTGEDKVGHIDIMGVKFPVAGVMGGRKSEADRAGDFFGFASGGVVGSRFMSPKGSDTIPAMLTRDEFVVNADSSRANRRLLEMVNSKRGPLYLAGGGVAVAPMPHRKYENFQHLPRLTPLPPRPEVAPMPREAWSPFGHAALFDHLARSQPGSSLHYASLTLRHAREREGMMEAHARRFDERAGGRGLTRRERGLLRLGEEGMLKRQQREFGRMIVDGVGGQANLAAYALSGLGDREMMGLGRPGVSRQRQMEAGLMNQTRQANWQQMLRADRDGEENPLRKFFARNSAVSPLMRAVGGLVPGFGTGDNVPAMLTPNEFVFSRQATSALGPSNLARLQQSATGGGTGGGGENGFDAAVQKLNKPVGDFSRSVGEFAKHVSRFDSAVQKLGEELAKFNGTVKVEGTQVITHAGSVTVVEGGRKEAISDTITDRVDEMVKKRMPDYF